MLHAHGGSPQHHFAFHPVAYRIEGLISVGRPPYRRPHLVYVIRTGTYDTPVIAFVIPRLAAPVPLGPDWHESIVKQGVEQWTHQ